MVTAIPPLAENEKLEIGPAIQAADNPAPNNIVVCSYNIRYGRGSHLISGGILRKVGAINHKRRPDLISQHISLAAKAFSDGRLLPAPHIILLQEADKGTVRAGGHHIAQELAAKLGMKWVHAPAGIPRGIKPVQRQWWLDFEEPIELNDPGDTGVAFLSKLPLRNVTRIDLPWHKCAWRPRLAIAATVSTERSPLRIINAHVDPHAAVDGQLEQLEAIATEADMTSGPALVLGDFNTLSKKKSVETRAFLESRGYSTPFPTATATWRGAGLRLHADWIFGRELKITKWGVARPLSVSDHWPIWVEVSME
jgi:endonuclease/exonuclease/phosphatase family metal-dependent hydrolase